MTAQKMPNVPQPNPSQDQAPGTTLEVQAAKSEDISDTLPNDSMRTSSVDIGEDYLAEKPLAVYKMGSS